MAMNTGLCCNYLPPKTASNLFFPVDIVYGFVSFHVSLLQELSYLSLSIVLYVMSPIIGYMVSFYEDIVAESSESMAPNPF
jgi:uncharacterized protein involved in cysteine biosynthesis